MSGALWFFSNHKRENNSAYSRLFPFLYSFSLCSFHEAICCYRLVRPFNQLLRVAKYTARLMPLEKKTQTAVYLYSRLGYKWLVCASAPDLQGNYHALIRESTVRETICCITLPLSRRLCETIHHFGARKKRNIESWSKLQKLLTLKSYRSTYVISSLKIQRTLI